MKTEEDFWELAQADRMKWWEKAEFLQREGHFRNEETMLLAMRMYLKENNE